MQENPVSQRLPLLKSTGMLALFQPIFLIDLVSPGAFTLQSRRTCAAHPACQLGACQPEVEHRPRACRVHGLIARPLSMLWLLASKDTYRLLGGARQIGLGPALPEEIHPRVPTGLQGTRLLAHGRMRSRTQRWVTHHCPERFSMLQASSCRRAVRWCPAWRATQGTCIRIMWMRKDA